TMCQTPFRSKRCLTRPSTGPAQRRVRPVSLRLATSAPSARPRSSSIPLAPPPPPREGGGGGGGGGSFGFDDGGGAAATVIVKACSATAPAASLTRSTTSWLPTSPSPGVPDRLAVPSPLSVNVSHAGSVGALIASVSPASGSVA